MTNVLDHDWWTKGPYYYWFRDITAWLPPGSGLLVDVGCGQGSQKRVVESKGYAWVGIDVDARLASSDVPVAFIEDGRFPLADCVADCMLCRQVLEHVEDLHEFATECHRTLKPNGLIYGSHGWLEPDHGVSYFGLSHDAIRVYLEGHGFELLRLEPGIHVGVLLLFYLFDKRVASHLARLVAAVQAVSDRRQVKRPSRLEDVGLSLLEFERENALRMAGSLLWIARKRGDCTTP